MKQDVTKRGTEFFLQAKAAEWAVASQLALRGQVPMFPPVDVGCDLVLNNGLRLQVKSASLRQNNQGLATQKNFGYNFDLRRGAWLSNERKYKKTSLRPYSEVADYFVLWGIEENRFFIVPTNHKRQRIWFNSKTATSSKSHNKRVFDQITADRIREFEDRWDLLDVDSAVEATINAEIVATPAGTF
jgi:hypothetical protein